jgi:hypothetical protein
MNNCWFVMHILIFKGLTKQCLYKSFGVKGFRYLSVPVLLLITALQFKCGHWRHIMEDLNPPFQHCKGEVNYNFEFLVLP